jgi:hypothetical protein
MQLSVNANSSSRAVDSPAINLEISISPSPRDDFIGVYNANAESQVFWRFSTSRRLCAVDVLGNPVDEIADSATNQLIQSVQRSKTRSTTNESHFADGALFAILFSALQIRPARYAKQKFAKTLTRSPFAHLSFRSD